MESGSPSGLHNLHSPMGFLDEPETLFSMSQSRDIVQNNDESSEEMGILDLGESLERKIDLSDHAMTSDDESLEISPTVRRCLRGKPRSLPNIGKPGGQMPDGPLTRTNEKSTLCPQSSDELSYSHDVMAVLEALELTQEEIDELSKVNRQRYPESSELYLTPEGTIMCASFTQLIIYLTNPDTGSMEFQQQFLLTFQSFATQRDFLAALLLRFFCNPDSKRCNVHGSDIKLVRDRVVSILAKWMTLASVEFSVVILRAIDVFCEVLSNMEIKNWYKIISSTRKKLYEKVILTDKPHPPVILPPGDENEWTLVSIPSEEMARQVTLVHSEIFQKIKPMELLACIWGEEKSGGSENLKRLTEHFNVFANAIILSVINPDTAVNRANVYVYWVEVGQVFLEQRNFHGVFCIVFALQHASINRLSETITIAQKLIHKKKLQWERMCNICLIDKDYAAYRAALNAALNPCIPFIGCFQKDLIYTQESYPNKIDKLINFRKCQECAKFIMKVSLFQNERYYYTVHPKMRSLITNELPEEMNLVPLMKLSQSKETGKKK